MATGGRGFLEENLGGSSESKAGAGVRAVENDYPDGQIVGDWTPFAFVVVAPNVPVVDQLQLADVTGPGPNTTTDPSLSGHVTADGAPQRVEVDFDYNGDGVVDASTTAGTDGSFAYTPVRLNRSPRNSSLPRLARHQAADGHWGGQARVVGMQAAPAFWLDSPPRSMVLAANSAGVQVRSSTKTSFQPSSASNLSAAKVTAGCRPAKNLLGSVGLGGQISLRAERKGRGCPGEGCGRHSYRGGLPANGGTGN